jgi:LPS export ABC transporter protein LptC
MIILIIVVGAVFFSYYRRSSSFQRTNTRVTTLLPENVSDATRGFSFSQSEHGQTIFEFKAESKLGFKDNKILMESVTGKVYGKQGDRYDTITSNRSEYDQSAEEITFLDNVVITLGSLGRTETRSEASTPSDLPTTLRVNKIKYAQKTGMARTDDEVTFIRGRIHGKSRGLTYDSKSGAISLLSKVEIWMDPADAEDSEVQLRCGSLTYYKTSNRIEMEPNVFVQKSYNEIQADKIIVFLDNTDSSLTRINALGNVRSVSRDPRFMLQVDARKVTYFFSQAGRWLSKVVGEGNVQSRSLDQETKRNIWANRMELNLRPHSNSLDSLKAGGNVVVIYADKRQDETTRLTDSRQNLEPGDRIIKSPEIWVSFEPEGRQISRIQTSGPSVLEEIPLQPKEDKKILSALELTLFFGKESSHVEKFTANREVKVDMIPTVGPVKRTTSDHLVADIDRQTRQVSQWHQFGHFKYLEEDRLANSTEAKYFAEDQVIELHGNPQIEDVNSKTTADIIEFHQKENLFTARGHVRTVFFNRAQNSNAGMFGAESPIYAAADFMEAQTQAGIAKYWKRAKMWQEDQVIAAATIYLYRSEKKLVAERNVRTLFYLENERKAEDKARKERQPITVQAQRMVYEDPLRKALYQENVRLNSAMGILNSSQLEVFLESNQGQTSVQRMLANGEVTIYQPGRTSFSDSAEYFRSEEKVVLRGGPPKVVDSERGSTSGARLTLYLNDGSMGVEGDPETRSVTRHHMAR